MGEQPLPENGACLLGSLNLTRFIYKNDLGAYGFNLEQMLADIPHIVRAMDNVIDETIYPLPAQEHEAKGKRRMGIGITGLANCLAALGMEYGSPESQWWLSDIMKLIANHCYQASSLLAKEKGCFPLYDKEKYLKSEYIKRLDDETIRMIEENGIRNSHLISIAPTGTISLSANNVSSGIEPVWAIEYERLVQTPDGPKKEVVQDYAWREWGIKCKTTDKVSVSEHVGMLVAAQFWVDSACSKTCNVGPEVTWEEFKEVYMDAWRGGAKGCTTFRASGKRAGILTSSASEDVVEEKDRDSDETVVNGGACYIDAETGMRSCDS